MAIDREYIDTNVKRYEKLLADANERAIAAIGRADYWTAMVAINEAAGHKACIEELEFQLDVMGV